MSGFKFTPALAQECGFRPEVLRELALYIDCAVAAGHSPGAVTLLAKGDNIIFSSVAGFADADRRRPLQHDAIFPLYSMSKPITAVAVLVLYDEGKWRLDDPVSRYLPEFKDIATLANSGASREPTILELFTHTAGFTLGKTVEEMQAAFKVLNFSTAKSLRHLIERYASMPLGYEPGTDWQYSIATDLLAEIVERITGERFDLFLARRVFQPLGMDDTSFELSYEQTQRLVEAHVRDTDTEKLRAARGEERRESIFPMGGTSFKSTALDFARFGRMLLNKGTLGAERILSEAAAELMLANHLSDQFLETPRSVLHYTVGAGNGHGLNGLVCIDPERANRPVGKGTYEWGGAFGTWFWIDPENDLIFVGMTNRMRDPMEKAPLDLISQEIVYRAYARERRPD